MFDLALRLKQVEAIHFELVGVLPETGAIVWWNGSATFQMAMEIDASRGLSLDGNTIQLMAAWTDHDRERDAEAALQTLLGLTTCDPFEDLPWNDENAYYWARDLEGGLGPVLVYNDGGVLQGTAGEIVL